jgi:hypothetical protein
LVAEVQGRLREHFLAEFNADWSGATSMATIPFGTAPAVCRYDRGGQRLRGG